MRNKSAILGLAVIVTLMVAGLVYAAVEISSEGTRKGPTDKINMVGPTVTESGGTTTIDVTSLNDGLTIDDSIYLTGGTSHYTPIYLPQSDGGCSRCGVDAAGTSFTCADMTCPAGMTP